MSQGPIEKKSLFIIQCNAPGPPQKPTTLDKHVQVNTIITTGMNMSCHDPSLFVLVPFGVPRVNIHPPTPEVHRRGLPPPAPPKSQGWEKSVPVLLLLLVRSAKVPPLMRQNPPIYIYRSVSSVGRWWKIRLITGIQFNYF